MRTVNVFERDLLRLLHSILQRSPMRSTLPVLLRAQPIPPCLSRAAVELIQDALRKGCVQLLAKLGGWQKRRHLRGGRPNEGRLWERTPPAELGLTFSRHTLAFLVWATGVEFAKPEIPLRVNPAELTIGDQLFFLLAYDVLRETEVGEKLRTLIAWNTNALVWLLYPDDATAAPTDAQCDFRPWTTGLGACVLEAIQPRLAERWVAVEQSKKSRRRTPEGMQLLGSVQQGVLGRFHAAVEAAQRRDLAMFELDALLALVADGQPARSWIDGVDMRGLRMADRQQTSRAACAFLEQIDRLRAWEREARTIGFYEDEFPAAQLWQSLWERHDGDSLLNRVHALIREVEPMHA